MQRLARSSLALGAIGTLGEFQFDPDAGDPRPEPATRDDRATSGDRDAAPDSPEPQESPNDYRTVVTGGP